MAKYIELERALALIRPDEPEDEKVAVTIATAKKLVRSILYRIPAADVAPVVRGRWIMWEAAGNDIPSPHRHECSVCHDVAQVLINGIELLSDYCPNCGAKMDGDK